MPEDAGDRSRSPVTEVAYVGDHSRHESLLHQALGDAPGLTWRGAVTGDIRELLTDPRSAIVILEHSVPGPVSAAREIHSALPTSLVFLLICTEERITAQEWEELSTLVQGGLSCERLTELSAPMLAASAEVSSVIRAISATTDAPARLLQSEVDVLECAADGLTAEETAHRLKISASGVRAFMLSARQRLRARTRTEAVAKALRAGILS